MLKDIREKKGISRYRLAKETGIWATTLYGWEKKNRTPSLKNLIKVADYLDVTIEELL